MAARTTIASLAAFALCHLLGLTQSYPAVLTAVIVMQTSVGASLKAMADRLLGSLVGAGWGVAVLLAIPPTDSWRLGIALTVALMPLALLAAWNPAFRVAPVTAIILLLIPSNAAGPFASAIQRVLEIGLGGVVAMAVALLVFPTRAHDALAEAAGRAVARMGDLAAIVMQGLAGRGDPDAVQSLHDDIRRILGEAENAGDEAIRERASYLASGPDPHGPHASPAAQRPGDHSTDHGGAVTGTTGDFSAAVHIPYARRPRRISSRERPSDRQPSILTFAEGCGGGAGRGCCRGGGIAPNRPHTGPAGRDGLASVWARVCPGTTASKS